MITMLSFSAFSSAQGGILARRDAENAKLLRKIFKLVND